MELTVDKIFNWFEYNNLKANASKCYFFVSSYQQTSININRSVIKSSNSEKLLGITIDNDFSFEEHINTLYRKASQKLHALFRVSQYLLQHKERILFKTFIMTQFNYCLLVWMCHSRGLNNKINHMHKRALSARSVSIQTIKFTGFTTEGQICVYPHEKLTIFSYGNL